MTFDPRDPLAEERTSHGVVIPRDNYENPMIVPRGEVAPITYTRASNLANYLVRNIQGIATWEKRLLAEALGRFPDIAALCGIEQYNTGLGLVQPILTPEENKASGKRLDFQIERALDRIGIHEKADAGTVAHAATEPGFAGVVPEVVQAAVDAIHELTAALEVVATEVFVVNDEIRAAGTLDHVYYIEDQSLARELSEELGVPLADFLIGDKKTGKNVHIGEFEVQVGGTYAHGEVYLGPPVDGEDQRLTLEEFLGGPVNRNTGLLVHASTTGSPKPRVLPLDLQRGLRLARSAAVTRDAQVEMDKVGIPKKVDVDKLASRVLEEQFDRLMNEDRGLPKEELRARGLALHGRFKHVWSEYYTNLMKEALA